MNKSKKSLKSPKVFQARATETAEGVGPQEIQKTKTAGSMKRSTGGEMYSANIDSKDIVKIIKACKESGVKQLKIGELDITFLDKTTEINQNFNSNQKIEDPMIEGEEDVNYEALSDEERKEMLILSDPDQWERQIIAEETEETFFIGTSPTL